MKKTETIREKSKAFAIRIINLYKYLTSEKKEFILSKQILKSGTSIGANAREADHGVTPADFVHKLSISQKECDETIYWLELLVATGYLNQTEFDSLLKDADEIYRMITSSILTTKGRKK